MVPDGIYESTPLNIFTSRSTVFRCRVKSAFCGPQTPPVQPILRSTRLGRYTEFRGVRLPLVGHCSRVQGFSPASHEHPRYVISDLWLPQRKAQVPGARATYLDAEKACGRGLNQGHRFPSCPLALCRLSSTWSVSRRCCISSRACSLWTQFGLSVFSLLLNAVSSLTRSSWIGQPVGGFIGRSLHQLDASLSVGGLGSTLLGFQDRAGVAMGRWLCPTAGT